MRLHTILFIACLWLSSCGQNQDPNETVVVEDGVKLKNDVIQKLFLNSEIITFNFVGPVGLFGLFGLEYTWY